MTTRQIFWLTEIGQSDNNVFGKKCANLGEMKRLGMPVPDGFAITCTTQDQILEATGARAEIRALLQETGEPKEVKAQAELSEKIREIVENKELPESFSQLVEAHYEELCARRGGEVAVAVRSAGVVSHPGMYETYLNMRGKEQVLTAIKKVWGSTFNSRTIAARVQAGDPIEGSPSIGVAVLEMVNAKSAGVCFTVHPVSGDPGKAVIEANWGLGESCVSGIVSVDLYTIDKESMRVIDKTLGEKQCQIIPKGNGVEEVKLSRDMRESYVLSDQEAGQIVKLGKDLEGHFGRPQDLEWAIDADRPFPDNVYLLQTRPVVGVEVKKDKSSQKSVVEDLVQDLFV